MSKAIKISKGLDVRLLGQAKPEVVETAVGEYAIKPKDFVGLTPKMLVEQGDKVKAGTPVFYAKGKERLMFTSPVSGTITAVERGEKRVINAIRIVPDGQNEYEDFSKESLSGMSREQVKEKMLASGVWTVLRQRPYSVIPDPDTTPKYIIVTGFSSAPLAPDYSILLQGERAAMQVGADALRKLTDGKVHVNVHSSISRTDELLKLENVQINTFEGKHPGGNVSVQAEKIDPINKGEKIWYLDAQDLAVIGKLFLEGRYVADKIIALTGEEVSHPQYYKIKRGANISSIIYNNVTSNTLRFISGNVLTGTKIERDGFLSYYDNQITVIREGKERRLFGWLAPGFNRFSVSRTFLSGFMKNCSCNKAYKVDTNLNGGERPLVFTGEFEKVFPMDIYPMQLIKACAIGDIDLMEQLGIYEVDPEDFALCELVDSSKTNIQAIIKQGLDLMRKEMGE